MSAIYGLFISVMDSNYSVLLRSITHLDVKGMVTLQILIANLEEDTTYDLTVTTGYGDQYVTVWIDFNDDYTFTNNERVVIDHVIAPGQGSGSYTETFDLDSTSRCQHNGLHLNAC